VTQYQLKMRPPPARAEGNGGASWQADADGFVEIYQGSEPSCKVPRLVPGQDYAFRVRAFNCIGGGPFSPEAIFSTNPSVPAQPGPPSTVAQTPTSVTLQWEAPHSGGAEITAYVLEIDDGEGGAFAMVYTGERTCNQLGAHEGHDRDRWLLSDDSQPRITSAWCDLAFQVLPSRSTLPLIPISLLVACKNLRAMFEPDETPFWLMAKFRSVSLDAIQLLRVHRTIYEVDVVLVRLDS
jgi:hypothetical protein